MILAKMLAPETAFFAGFKFSQKLFLFFGEIFGGFDDNCDDVGTAIAVGAEGYAVARKFKGSAGLGTSGDFHGDFAIDGFDIDFTTEGGVNHGNFFFGKNDDTFAGEVLMRFDANLDIKIAFFAAFGRRATATS